MPTNYLVLSSDVTEWMSILGYDIGSLVPDVSYTGQIRPRGHERSYTLLPTSSAFECTFLQDMTRLLTMSVVPKSKVSPLQSHKRLSPAAMPGILGDGITVSYNEGKAKVSYLDTAPSWAKQLAMVLINGSHFVDLKFNIKGRDIHYLLKFDVSKAEDEIKSLGLESSSALYAKRGINITIHRSEHKARYRADRFREVDVRLHGKYSVINIRYGSTLEREKQRILNHSKDRAVQHAWQRERWRLQNGLQSNNRWTDEEKLQITTLGYAEGYQGHYLRNTDLYPELADDCNNIRFIKDNR